MTREKFLYNYFINYNRNGYEMKKEFNYKPTSRAWEEYDM